MTLLIPAQLTHLATSAAIPNGADGWTGNFVGLTATRTGQWTVVARSSAHGPAAGARICNAAGTPLNGAGGYFWHLDTGGAIVGTPTAGDVWEGFLNNGDSLYIQVATASFGAGTAFLDMWFNPTPTNR